MPYDDPLCLHVVGMRGADLMRKAFEISDLVVLIGYDAIEFEPKFWNCWKEQEDRSHRFRPARDGP